MSSQTTAGDSPDGKRERNEPAESSAAPANFRGILKSWWYFFLLLALIILVGLFYAEENWRGQRAWSKYKERLAASGVPMEPAAVVPKPVPLSENFASTPFLAPLFDFIPGTQRWRTTNGMSLVQGFAPAHDAASHLLASPKRSSSNSWFTASADLQTWYAAFETPTNSSKGSGTQTPRASPGVSTQQAAAGVLAALAETDPVIEELREASRRPYCRFEIQYDTDDPAAILLPHLAVLRHLCSILQLRVSSELASGRVNEAAQDVELMLYLTEATREEPIVVSQFVRMSQARQALQSIGEGIGQWSTSQLRSFQERLEHFDFCEGMRQALDAERVFFGGGMIDFVHHHPEMYNALSGGTERELTFPGVLWAAAPGGWFDLEKVNYHSTFERYRVPGLDLSNHLITPAATGMTDSRMTRLAHRPWPLLFVRHEVFSALMLPAFSGAYRKTAFAQTGVDIGAIVCAIERYRLAHGRAPESLELLTQVESGGGAISSGPTISRVPLDIINGKPLNYRREQDGGGYVLYSVGWNAIDDGGTNVITKGEGEIPLLGDWVWRQPGK